MLVSGIITASVVVATGALTGAISGVEVEVKTGSVVVGVLVATPSVPPP